MQVKNLRDQWGQKLYILNEWQPLSNGPNLTITWSNCSQKWRNLARFGNAWVKLLSIEQILQRVLGYKVFELQDQWILYFFYTDTVGRFRCWCQKFMLWWPSTVCWGIFGAGDEFVLMMKDLLPPEGIHQATGPKGLGGRSCHSTPWTIILPPSPKPKFTKRVPVENVTKRAPSLLTDWPGAALFYSHVDYLWVWEWSVRAVSTAEHRCWHRVYPVEHLQSEPS